MKRILVFIVGLCILTGCSGSNEVNRAMTLRKRILTDKLYAFDGTITADYGDRIHTFGIACQSDEMGTLQFEVTRPETIAGISGKLSSQGGNLTFDNKMLAFELLVDDQLSPVSTPWIVMHAVHSGYINSAGNDGDDIYIQIDDSYRGEALRVDLWCDSAVLPKYAEILYCGKRILSIEIENFRFL